MGIILQVLRSLTMLCYLIQGTISSAGLASTSGIFPFTLCSQTVALAKTRISSLSLYDHLLTQLIAERASLVKAISAPPQLIARGEPLGF